MNDPTPSDKFIKYLTHQMSPDENSNFEKELASDASMRKELEVYQNIITASEIEGVRNLKSHFEDVERKIKFKSRLSIIAAAIVLVILVAAALKLSTTPKEPTLFATYFEPYKNPTVTRSQVFSEKHKRAAIAFQNQEYNQAANMFSQLCVESNLSDACFYASLSRLYESPPQIEIAEKEFQVVSSSSLYRPIFLWYTALAQLQTDQPLKAKETLQTLLSQYDYKQKEANEILAILNSNTQ